MQNHQPRHGSGIDIELCSAGKWTCEKLVIKTANQPHHPISYLGGRTNTLCSDCGVISSSLREFHRLYHCIFSDIRCMSAHASPRAHRGDDKAGGSHNANHAISHTAVQTPSDSQGDDANDASMNGTSSGFAPTLEPAPLTRFPSDLGLKSPMTGFLDNPSLPRYIRCDRPSFSLMTACKRTETSAYIILYQ